MRQHVTQGQCPTFDPTKQPYELPVAPHWLDIIRQGDVAGLKTQPSTRLRLTLTCQICGLGLDRQMDLALHLQSVHSGLWLRSQSTTQMLLKTCYPIHGCLCNPVTNGRSVSHVCPLYRQLAMLHLRTDLPLLVPWKFTTGSLHASMPHVTEHPVFAKIIQYLTDREFELLYTSMDIHHFLNSECLLCGGHFTSAALIPHILLEHAHAVAGISDLMPQLLECFRHGLCNDHQCNYCHNIFNLPSTAAETSQEHVDRTMQAQTHLQYQCPVLLQTGILLSHGRYGSPDDHDGTEPRAADGAGRHGPIGHTGPHQKRRRTRTQESQEGPAQAHSAPADGHQSGDAAPGGPGTPVGPGQSGTEKARLLRMLFAERSTGHSATPGTHRQAMASSDVPAGPHHEGCIDLCAPEGHPVADTGTITATTPAQAQPVSTTGPDLPDCGPTSHAEPGRILPIPSLESNGPEANGDGPDTHSNGQDDPVHWTVKRPGQGQLHHPEIPCTEGLGIGPDGPLDASGGCTPRRNPCSPTDLGGEQSLGPDWHVPEASHAATEWTCGPPSGHDGQGTEEGTGQREKRFLNTMYTDRTSLCLQLSTLALANESNDCFCNAAFHATLWAMVNRFDFQLSDLGHMQQRLSSSSSPPIEFHANLRILHGFQI